MKRKRRRAREKRVGREKHSRILIPNQYIGCYSSSLLMEVYFYDSKFLTSFVLSKIKSSIVNGRYKTIFSTSISFPTNG